MNLLSKFSVYKVTVVEPLHPFYEGMPSEDAVEYIRQKMIRSMANYLLRKYPPARDPEERDMTIYRSELVVMSTEELVDIMKPIARALEVNEIFKREACRKHPDLLLFWAEDEHSDF